MLLEEDDLSVNYKDGCLTFAPSLFIIRFFQRILPLVWGYIKF